MKEQEPNGLTNQHNSSNLGGEGNVFMTDAGNTELGNIGPQTQEAPKEPEVETQPSTLNLSENGKSILGQMLLSGAGESGIPNEVLMEIADTMDKTGADRTGSVGQQALLRKLAGSEEAHGRAVNTQAKISSIVDKIKHSSSMQEADAEIESFLDYANKAKDILSDEEKEAFDKKIQEITLLKQSDFLGVKSLVDGFSKDVEKHFRGPDLRFEKALPESLEELVSVVMAQAEEDWKTGNEKQLIDENGKVVKENFIAWIRYRMIALHDFNPTQKVNFFQDINVKYGFSQISFYDMIFTGSYFMEKKKNVVLQEHEDGSLGKIESDMYVKNADYEEMKQQLIMEAFLFSNSRNNDVEYQAVMGQESELPKLLAQIYYANPFLRGEFMEKVLTMPSMDKSKMDQVKKLVGDDSKFEKEKIKSVLENNLDVGEGIRKALLSYYYINDYEMLENILGKDAVLFSEEYDEMDLVTGKPKKDDMGQDKKKRKGEINSNMDDSNENKIKYDSKGMLVDDGKNIHHFIGYVNVFNRAQKDESIVAEVRERIVQSLMQKGLNYTEAKYAEAWAFSMTRWTGIGARNDTEAVAYDAWSKTQNFLEYRIKQMNPKRRGVAGNIYNLAGIKKAGLSMFEGITDVKGRTIIDAIQGGEGEKFSKDNPFKKDIDEDGKLEKNDKLRFAENMGKAFSTNHITNSFKIYDFLINHTEFNIENMVTYDSYGRVIIDNEKANKMIDGIQKAIRYAYCTWGGIDYSKKIRVYEGEDHDPKELPIAAAMFGPDILKLIQMDLDKRGIKGDGKQKYEIGEDGEKFDMDFTALKDGGAREMLWKHALSYLIAKEVHSHRDRHSSERRFDTLTVEKIYDFLKVKGLTQGDYELEEMRKMSNSRRRVLFAEDFVNDGGKGALIGFWKAMKIMFKDVASDAIK